MVYKKYGQTFKHLREQQGISLDYISSAGISKSSLSKFERGESMMAFDKVTLALQQLDITLEEFELFLNGSSLTESDSLLSEIEDAKIRFDNSKLDNIYHLAIEKDLTSIALAAKASYTSLSQSDIEILDKYFYEITIPGTKELRILYLTMSNLPPYTLLQTLDFLYEDKHKILFSPKHKNYYLDACVEAVKILIQHKLKNYATHIMTLINSLLTSDPQNHNLLFYKILYRLLNGFWIYTFENRTRGGNLINRSLDILKEISSPEVSQYYEKTYKSL